MKREKIIQISFIISVVAVIIGAFLKIMHWELALFFLTFGIAALAVFTLLSIYEVTNSVRIKGSEKFMWVFGFLFLGQIAGLIYILSARKRII